MRRSRAAVVVTIFGAICVIAYLRLNGERIDEHQQALGQEDNGDRDQYRVPQTGAASSSLSKVLLQAEHLSREAESKRTPDPANRQQRLQTTLNRMPPRFSGDYGIDTRPENSSQAAIAPPIEIDKSVMGKPFSLSRSSMDACSVPTLRCPEDLYDRLKQMAQEPRSIQWAAENEAKIRERIETEGADKFQIRNIECRASICAVEVASISGPYLGFHYGFLMKNGMSIDNPTIGVYETDPVGARITITTITLHRVSRPN